MAVLDAGNVAPKKPGALLYVALREFLFFTKFAESVAYDHAGIISLNQTERNKVQKEAGLRGDSSRPLRAE